MMGSVLRSVVPFLLGTLLLTGCALQPAEGLPGKEALEEPRTLTQQIEARWKDSSGSLLTILQVENGELDFLATTLLGQEVFHLHYNGVTPILLSHSDTLPRHFRADYLLRDLLWGLWPATSLRPALERAGLVLDDSDATRTIHARADKGGRVVLSIQRRGQGIFHIENPRFGYVLDLSPANTGEKP
ncbi:MAG: DUF3261 domain-containing protein [Moraxellaceae bacterium]|nr:DUF3261 domain-containing protein [Moraxellaceae bacterium]